MQTELKPCPFCGVVPRLGFRRDSTGDYCTLYAEHSEDCYFSNLDGDNDTGRASAVNHGTLIRKWNLKRRPRGSNS